MSGKCTEVTEEEVRSTSMASLTENQSSDSTTQLPDLRESFETLVELLPKSLETVHLEVEKVLLKASSIGDLTFIRHIVANCNEKGLEKSALLWNHLRSVKDKDGYSPLHRGVICGQKDVIEILLMGPKLPSSNGHPQDFPDFDVLHARTPEGWTALHFAAMGDGRAYENILGILIKCYESIQKPDENSWDFADNVWLTPLHYAVLGYRQAQIEQLLQWRGYDRHVNAGDYHLKTPLHMAVCHPKVYSFVELLAKRPPTSFSAPLVRDPYIHLIETLSGNPIVDIQAVDCCLYSPLHWAVHVGNTAIVRFLASLTTENRVRSTQKDIQGRPPLQIAVENTAVNREDAEHLDHVEHWEFFHESSKELTKETLIDRKVYKDIAQLLLGCVDVTEEVKRLYRDRQVYVDAMNAILVGAALVASVTFQGWLQPPTGDGTWAANDDIRRFWISNSLSFSFSIAAVMAGAAGVLPMGKEVYIGKSVETLRHILSLTAALLTISAVLVCIAFVSAGWASLTTVPVTKLNVRMMVAMILGSSVCTSILILFLDRLRRILPGWAKRTSDVTSSLIWMARAIKRRVESIGQHRQQDPALEVIRTNLKNTWTRSWGISTTPTPAEDTQIDEVLNSAFKADLVESSAGAKANKVQREMRVYERLEKVYENVRKEMYNRDGRGLKNMRFICGDGLRPRAIHYWMNGYGYSPAVCRAHSPKVDQERWRRINNKFNDKHKEYRE